MRNIGKIIKPKSFSKPKITRAGSNNLIFGVMRNANDAVDYICDNFITQE